jgi:hypothetical protein
MRLVRLPWLTAFTLLAVAASSPATADARELTLRSRVSGAGLGPLKIGMTISRAEEATGRRFTVAEFSQGDCGGASMHPNSYGVGVLTTGGRVARIMVGRRGIATSAGIRVHDSVAKLKRRYGSKLVAVPEFYVPSQLNYELRSGNRKVIFKTDNKRVMYIFAGRKPEVDYVEGCF